MKGREFITLRGGRLAARGACAAAGHPFFAAAGASPRQRDHALQ
jgi:hypothetical protein